MLAGAQYWDSMLTAQGAGVNVADSAVAYNDADIKVYMDVTLMGTTTAAQASFNAQGRGWIGINADDLGNANTYNFWAWTAAHEVGHMFDRNHINNGNCLLHTVMYSSIFGNMPALPSSLCSDWAFTADKHGYNGMDYCDFGCPAGFMDPPCVGDQQPDPNNCNCCINYTPILIDLGGDGFELGGPLTGPVFRINTCESVVQVGWPVSRDDVWLVLDVNGNGRIDDGSEMFGNATRLSGGGYAKNGYQALAQWDENYDRVIDDKDAVFRRLEVWGDSDRDGVSERHELSNVARAGIVSIDLRYRDGRRVDQWGNRFVFVGRVMTDAGVRRSSDVILATLSVTRQ
jgi:hypothetical protein